MSIFIDPELQRVYAVLREHPEGLTEYELLQELRGSAPLRGLDELETFRVHFLLFHHLYRLRRCLERERSGSLEIHCLKIRLAPVFGAQSNPSALPLAPDPLAEYYLDPQNLAETTQEDVLELLQWFWRRYRAHGRREEALEVLDLHPEASTLEIRQRFRQLVRVHHPDAGGDPAQFRELAEAMEVLRLYDSSPPQLSAS